jgi:serine/threonine-protein kinase
MLDRYRYISRLGSGGSSTVMLAEDTVLGRLVALKRVYASDDVTARSRLHREAVIGATVSHPNLVSVFDIFTSDDGDEVIVMEYVEGETLAAKIRRGDRMDLPSALAVLNGVSSALDAIHARGIIHRDVKPANVLLGADGLVKLADLGIASVPDGTEITTGDRILGTFRYMAPEQLESSRATPAVDVYALAMLAFEALSGQRARHEPNPLALAHAIASQPPPDLRAVWPEAPDGAADVLRRGMARDPNERPLSAGELVAQLREALEPRPTRAVRPLPLNTGSVRRRSGGALVAVAATVLAALAVAAIVLAYSGKPRQSVAAAQVIRPASHPVHHPVSRPVVARTKHRAAPVHKTSRAASQATVSASGPSTTVGSAASSSTQPPVAPPVPAPSPPPTANTTAGSPIGAVEAFYHLAASHQFAAAWGLMDPAFRQQLEGYQGLEATMAAERAIIFNAADLVDQSPNSAVVSVRTTSVQDSGSQSCSGTVNLLRAGSAAPGWVLDHIAISCV